MNTSTKGAWLIHHARKLQATTSQDFDAIGFAGRSGTLLSAISASNQSHVSNKRLAALAKANGISPKTEMPSILSELERQRLVALGADGIEVLGLTGKAILEHTARIFSESDYEPHEDAAIIVAEIASERPTTTRSVSEYISDTLKLSSQETGTTLALAANIGFFDTEPLSGDDSLVFNSNLFRRDDATKISAIMSSLSGDESRCLIEATQKLQDSGCVPLDEITNILGKSLFSKLHSIAFFDVSAVGNDEGKRYFVTRPAAFSKFSNSIADDAFDLAKALVASLTYGMTVSSHQRGRIQAISALMNKLIAGSSVGPATAIGSDYQALEQRGVVRVTPAERGMFTMKLLKPEVGRLALAVIESGDASTEVVTALPGARVTLYATPESNREAERKNVTEPLKRQTLKLLQDIRTGGLKR
ncbi:MAG: hypothetical protein IBJ03_10420 [Gemmatimonadaceae bacterium]|nr:hypothetical protein [Gemmatimonadaceae bacterium]